MNGARVPVLAIFGVSAAITVAAALLPGLDLAAERGTDVEALP
jgi:hypothetical protein